MNAETGTPRDTATAAQLAASNPEVSAFVAASAGSGKTKLLTDRLLRLMLHGVAPERIQCLTFTKAAAAEMSLRLQRQLGDWVRMDDAALASELRRLQVYPDSDVLRRARDLFTTVLDLPGGMRIGTIHAFCQSLLRRFPLEAALSPHFQLIEDAEVANAWSDAREQVLAEAAPDVLDVLSPQANLAQLGELIEQIGGDRERAQRLLALGPDRIAATQRRALGITAEHRAAVIAVSCGCPHEDALRTAAEIVAARGSTKCAARAQAILAWLDHEHPQRAERWHEWHGSFIKKDGERFSDTTFVNEKLLGQQPALADSFVKEAERILEVEDACLALEVATISDALVRLAIPVMRAYADRKSIGALVDFNDLIDRTRAVLHDPGAAWVLYKMDGGIDHLLLDEAQDTAPAQWDVAHALVQEFFAGASARDEDRTVFAVGDRKQSIYSFQGADVRAFDAARERWRGWVQGARRTMVDTPLPVSFRSTTPILQLVDRMLADPISGRGAQDGNRHFGTRLGQAGSVELWPLAPAPDPQQPEPWKPARDYVGQTSAPQRLADRLARWVAKETNGSVMLDSHGRPLRPGDVLILVRRRNDFARALVRALKAQGVPVGGMDRMVLTSQPAVQDLLTLCDALLLPEDDLSLACFLTSPLGGVSDESLMVLAADRPGRLWTTLRDQANEAPDWRFAWEMFSALRGRTDFTTPFGLLTEILGSWGGHARLFARLGPEAGEPVDELLHAARAFARTHPPSLQGFLHWIRRSGAEVKREQEGGGNLVRIMTVHGAKGLQAPLVILPDTTGLPDDRKAPVVWADAPGGSIPLWSPRKALSCAFIDGLRSTNRARQMEEHNRLLYVALTRAEDRLVICGAAPRNAPRDECWYSAVERAFAGLETVRAPFEDWGELRRFGCAQSADPDRRERLSQSTQAVAMPAWAGRAPAWRPSPLPAEPARPMPLAPSRPEGVELGPVPHAASPFAGGTDRFARGRLVHGLLQHLPSLPRDRWTSAARVWLARPGHALTADEAERIAEETLGILTHPDLAELFGPGGRAEVPITGVVGDSVVGGMVDRMAVLPDRVLLADFKTNRRPPSRVEDTPVLYVRQMAAYRSVLRQVFPDRPVSCALVWTHTGHVSILPEALLD